MNRNHGRTADPQFAFAVLVDGVHCHGGDLSGAIDAHQAVAIEAEQAVVGPGPKDPIPGLQDGADEVVGQTLSSAVCAELSVFVAEESGPIGAGPEAAIAGHGQTEDAVIADSGRGIAVEDHKAGAVETDEPTTGSDPEIVVGGLGERLDGILGKAVLRLPHSPGVAFRQRPFGGRLQTRP